MQSLTTHYQQLLGLPSTWRVENVDLSMTGMQVVIRLAYIGKNSKCPECGEACGIYDHAPEQKWRHLHTIQFESILVARLPRTNCTQCRVKTLGPPRADKHSRFTLMLEGFVVQLLQHYANTQAVAKLLGLSWHCVNDIMCRAVNRGMERRDTEVIEHLGIDEKSFRTGHQYVTTLNDLDAGRVLDVVETKTKEATELLLRSIKKRKERLVSCQSQNDG